MGEEEEPGRPWGLAATAGLSLGVVLLWLGVESAVILALTPWAPRSAGTEGARLLSFLAENGGLVLSLTILATAVVTVGAVLGLVRLRRSLPIRSYLALRPVGSGELLRFLALAVLLAAASDALTWLSGRPVVPAVMAQACRTAHSPLLYWSALVLAAPLAEELLFRGFLFKGLLHSRLGATGAVLITALAWAAIHRQYAFFYLVIVFAIGLLLGYARLATDSLVTPLAMHVTLNLIATLEAVFFVRGGI